MLDYYYNSGASVWYMSHVNNKLLYKEYFPMHTGIALSGACAVTLSDMGSEGVAGDGQVGSDQVVH